AERLQHQRYSDQQHFPGQTHTDPGANWYWDYYFKLVNNNPSVSNLTTSAGNFYDSGGAGANYTDDERMVWTIQPTGASSVTLNFTSFALEANYDFMYIYDGSTIWAPLIGRFNTISPGSVTSSGGALTIEFRSDCATNAAGWVANWTSVQPDTVLPTTTISAPNNWKTADFTATFTDADNTGVEKAFYNVIDFDGNYWSANASNGFFADNFDTLQTFWTDSAGTWNVSGNELIQSDEVESNSNIFTPLNQNLSNRYLYHFIAKVEGTGTNRRFGFHLFCDNASQTNRGNSYFVWFRVEGQTLEFFKVTNNTYTTASKVISNVITTPGVYYDFKITYDRLSGTITVWRNNVFMGSWTDPAPYSTNGNYISFRSGNSKLTVSDINVYRSRYPTALITLNDSTKNIRFQNPDPLTFGAKIKSIVVDANNNLSTIAGQNLNIDWTLPDSVIVNDGSGIDIDTTVLSSVLYANWASSFDTQSGIAKYWYAIGTSAGATDVTNWTTNNLDTSVIVSGLSLISGQTYYFSVKAENGAGLCTVSSSDGIYANISTNVKAIGNTENISVYLNPADNILYFTLNNKSIVELFDMVGNLILIKNLNETHERIDINNLSKGFYLLKISGDSFHYSKKLIKY
ncbi:MAG: CUB domain-containing protein, partial [Bacteroidota bacterium]